MLYHKTWFKYGSLTFNPFYVVFLAPGKAYFLTENKRSSSPKISTSQWTVNPVCYFNLTKEAFQGNMLILQSMALLLPLPVAL